MKLKIISSIILLLFILPVHSKNNKKNKPKAIAVVDSLMTFKSEFDYVNPVVEKVYLHFDRSSFISGEDVWFKAYLVNSLSQELTATSKVLYVELISPESEIIQQRVIRMDEGVGFGDFSLKRNLESGIYLVRAYTQWMKNFSNDFIFKKQIKITNLRNLYLEDGQNTSSIDLNTKIDLNFFPEGGSMVDGVRSRIAFKATDDNNLGCAVEGKIISSLGEECASFKSNSFGMGSFFLTPTKDVDYHAIISNTQYSLPKSELPVTFEDGYVMRVVDYDEKNVLVSINTNTNTQEKYPDHKLTLIGEFRGKQVLHNPVKIKSTSCRFLVSKKNIPEGIVRFTLSDQNKPWCERLFYFDRKEQLIVNIKQDKASYKPHEKVNLQISLTNEKNRPVAGNLSLSATDKYISNNINESNIYSYFLLESDIRGNIEQPAYYFDLSNPNRLIDLDLLLLTQGWRDFKWKYLTDTIIPMQYSAESGIDITGKLYSLISHKPKAEAVISLALTQNGKAFFEQRTTDKDGSYKFEGLCFTGECDLMVSAFNSNHSPVGEIILDSISYEPFKISYVPVPIHPTKYDSGETSKEDFLLYLLKNKTDSLPAVIVEDVDVVANRIIKERNYTNPYYDEPNWSHSVDAVDYCYLDVLEFLKGRVPGVSITGDKIRGHKIIIRGMPSVNEAGNSVLLLLDGVQVDELTLIATPMSIIDKIDVIKQGAGIAAANGIISVYTKKGAYVPAREMTNSIKKTVKGYYEARVFYAPEYGNIEKTNDKPDMRSTIFWEPNILTDEEGKATVSFYNDDCFKYVKVKVEGIVNGSVPVVAQISYMVE